MSAFISWNRACQMAGLPSEYAPTASIRATMLKRHTEQMQKGVVVSHVQAKQFALQAAMDRAGPSYVEWFGETVDAIHLWFAEHSIYVVKCRTSDSFRLETLSDDWKAAYEEAIEEAREAGLVASDEQLLGTPTGYFRGTLSVLSRYAANGIGAAGPTKRKQ